MRATIQTFTPEPYILIKPFEVVILKGDNCYVSSFLDANIHSGGETVNEAFDNLKYAILYTYKHLSCFHLMELGPVPTRQLAVLREFISGPVG